MFEPIDRRLPEKVKQGSIVDMQMLAVNIPFFLWYFTFTSQKGWYNVYTLPSINVQATEKLLFMNSSRG